MGTKILVVDDEPSLTSLVKKVLTSKGYEVFIARVLLHLGCLPLFT